MDPFTSWITLVASVTFGSLIYDNEKEYVQEI